MMIRKITMRIAEVGDDFRIEQCELLGENGDDFWIKTQNGVETLKTADLDQPKLYTYFSSDCFGDMAIYTLYTSNPALTMEELQADFRRELKRKFSFFYSRSLP